MCGARGQRHWPLSEPLNLRGACVRLGGGTHAGHTTYRAEQTSDTQTIFKHNCSPPPSPPTKVSQEKQQEAGCGELCRLGCRVSCRDGVSRRSTSTSSLCQLVLVLNIEWEEEGGKYNNNNELIQLAFKGAGNREGEKEQRFLRFLSPHGFVQNWNFLSRRCLTL